MLQYRLKQASQNAIFRKMQFNSVKQKCFTE